MGGAESRGADADSLHLVLLVVARLKLWLILMVKIFLRPTFVIEPVILANLMTY